MRRILIDANGEPMTPTHAVKKVRRRHGEQVESTERRVINSRRVDLLDDKRMTLAAQPQRAPDSGATHAGRDESPPTRLWPPGAGADALRDAAATTTAIEPLTPEEVRQMERERRSGFAQRVHVPPPSRR